MQMVNSRKHIVVFCCISSMLKIMVGQMCQLMHCITEFASNAMCEELKVEYVDKPGVYQYIEGGWFGLTCVSRNMAQVW